MLMKLNELENRILDQNYEGPSIAQPPSSATCLLAMPQCAFGFFVQSDPGITAADVMGLSMDKEEDGPP
jgi:hypothetical protein